MDDIENHSSRLYRSQGISDLTESIVNSDTMLILRGVVPPSCPSLANQ